MLRTNKQTDKQTDTNSIAHGILQQKIHPILLSSTKFSKYSSKFNFGWDSGTPDPAEELTALHVGYQTP